MKQEQTLIFASRQPNNGSEPEQIVGDLVSLYSSLEYGDVAERCCQIWEYPSGKILAVVPDRKVDKRHYHTVPYTTPGTAWLPRLQPVDVDKEKVETAYKYPMQLPDASAIGVKFE
jgi:hypothetical protein